MHANLLLEFLIAALAPFLPTQDAALARQAAEETIAAYNAQDTPQLVTIGRLVTCALAAIDNLRLSAPPDLSLTLKLKLRGNAGTLNLAAERATATLEGQRHAATPPQRDETEIRAALAQARPAVRQAQASQPPASPTPHDLAWANGMAQVAAEFTAELPTLPPPQQDAHLARIAALATVSDALATGRAPPARARLLHTTALGRGG